VQVQGIQTTRYHHLVEGKDRFLFEFPEQRLLLRIVSTNNGSANTARLVYFDERMSYKKK
jgi:hypothetical protein